MSENKTDTESSKSEATTKTGQTQYKATRIWYEIINAFREEVPLKKHWRNFRTYQDCFSASEAVEWLYRYLKSSPNFKSHTTLTRQQAIQLLQIFLKEKIIEDVRASDIKFTFKDFQDDDRLYKFCTSNRFYKNATKAAEANKDQLMSSKSALKNEETTENASSKTGAQNESKAETKKTTDEKLAEIKENLINNKPVTNKENVKPVITNSTLVLNLNTSKASEKKKETYEEKSEVKLFNSKLSDSTNKVPSTINIQRADSLKRRPTISRAHHYNNGKLVSVKLSKHEEEIWSKVAQKLLESIIKKALAFNQTNSTQNQFTRHTSSSSVFLDSKNSGPENVQKLLFSGINDLKIIVGANIHHNCTHVNKHGVVIETEEDFPQWLVKAMTCLMNWKDEPDEFPRFQDVFSEVNNHFNELNEPLISKEIGSLFKKSAELLLLPQCNTLENSRLNTSNCMNTMETSVMHESNKKTFDNLIQNLKTHMNTNMSMMGMNDKSEHSFCQNTDSTSTIKRGASKSYMRSYCDEELKLIENAKLSIIPDSKMTFKTDEQKHQLIQDIFLASVVELEECCEDCLHKYNAINNFINKNAIEFNEFVSSLNYMDNYLKPDIDSIIDPYEFNKQLNKLSDSDLYHTSDPYVSKNNAEFENALRMKESQERFASLKLKFSPIKTNKPQISETNIKTLPKSVSEKRLHRNNSFRTAIGSIESKTEMLSNQYETQEQPACKVQKRSAQIGYIQKKLSNRSTSSKQDEAGFKRPSNPDNNSHIGKSCSMNSIQGIFDSKQESVCKLNESEIESKRKLLKNSTNSLSEKISGESKGISNSRMNGSVIFRHSSLDQETPSVKSSLRSLKSYSDLCCSGGFENRSLNKYFSNSMNLDDISNQEENNKSMLKLSNVSLNTLGGLLKSSTLPRVDPVHERRMIFKKVFSLSAEIESETLCFLIKAFRICALMLPPTNKRKLHLLLRFLYKLRYDQHSCKYLIENADDLKPSKKQNAMGSILEDVKYIDESMTNNNGETNTYRTPQQKLLSSAARAADNARELDSKSKEIEKLIIRSFYKSIVPMKKTTRRKSHGDNIPDAFGLDLTKIEEEQFAMKLVQILINNYPEIMRIPDELIQNVNYKLTSFKSSGDLHSLDQINNNHAPIKMTHQQYDKQSAELSKQHLTELLNSILTDMQMKDEEKIMRLKRFKEHHPDVYEEKYPTIKKALNILGLNNAASFLEPNIHLIQSSCFLVETNNARRESDYYSLKKRTALTKLTESAKKKTGLNASISSGISLNQTTIISSTSSSSSVSSIGFPKFFNKRKKENLI